MILFIVIIIFLLIAAGLMWFLLSHDRGEKEPVSALWIAAGFGVVGAVLAAIIEGFAIPQRFVDGSSQPLGLLLLAMLGVGLIEECCKFLPLALFIYRKRYFNEHTDGIIYFAVAGLAFGVPENILYAVAYGSGTGILRIFLTPLFHVTTTAMVGYYLAGAKIERKPLRLTALALVGAIIIHGLYDFGLGSGENLLAIMSLMITVGMTAVFFIFFMRANEKDQAQGLSSAGHNSFCRVCGYPNPKHNLYCTHCGQRA